jgi:hypothetical protein
MNAYLLLESQPEFVKRGLIEKFGSLHALYDLLYKIESRELEYSYKKDTERLYHNRYERYKIEKGLEQLGVDNAAEITWEVAQECTEKLRREYLL